MEDVRRGVGRVKDVDKVGIRRRLVRRMVESW